MALQKTEAILLRRQEVRETSLMLVAFSRDLGKFHGLVKGVRGARAAVPWFLEPLTLQSVILYERRRSPWVLVSAFDLLDPFDAVRRDLVRTAYAGFCLDLTDAMTETGDPHPEIFELLLAALRGLGQGADPRSMARCLEVRLLSASGLLPEADALGLTPGAALSLQQILQTPLERINRLRLARPVEEELRVTSQRRLHGVLNRELKSRNFLQALGLETTEAGQGVPPATRIGGGRPPPAFRQALRPWTRAGTHR